MAAHGGYRKPSNPAPVSGPGALSKRTDGGPGAQTMSAPTGMPYGEHQALMQQESSAPMSASATPPPAPSIAPGGAPTSAPGQGPAGVPFGAPTTMPNQPVTHGVDIGLGAGSESLPVEQQPQYAQQGPMTQMLSQLAARDTTGVLAQLYQSARSSGA